MNKADQKEDDGGHDDQPRPLPTTFPVIDNRARSTRLPALDVSNGNRDEEGQEEQPTSSNSKDSSSKSPSPPLHHEDETIVPNSSDILLGRGKPYQNHEGNMTMRRLIDEYKERYQAASRIQKPFITEELLSRISETGARFLKRDEEAGQWVEVTRGVAFEKLSHAFRSRIGVSSSSSTSSSTSRPRTIEQPSLVASIQGTLLQLQPPPTLPQASSFPGTLHLPRRSVFESSDFSSQQQQQQQQLQLQQLVSLLTSSLSSSLPSSALATTASRSGSTSIDDVLRNSNSNFGLGTSTPLSQYLAAGSNRSQFSYHNTNSRINAPDVGTSINSSLLGGNLSTDEAIRLISSAIGNEANHGGNATAAAATSHQPVIGESAQRVDVNPSLMSPTAQRAYYETLLLGGILQQQQQQQRQQQQPQQQQQQQVGATAAQLLQNPIPSTASFNDSTRAQAQLLLQQQLSELLSNVSTPTSEAINPSPSPPPPKPPPPPSNS